MLDFDVFEEKAEAARLPWQARPLVVFETVSFLRRLSVEVLRFAGAARVIPTGCPRDALETVRESRDAMLICGWEGGDDGLALVRRLRVQGGPERRSQALIVSQRKRAVDIEDARDAGVDGYLLRPFCARDLERRMRQASSRPARFIETARFAGPDRRRPRPGFGEPRYKRGADVSAGLVDAMQAALNQADDMAFQSMRRGDPIGARVGRSLRRFLEGLDALTPQAREIIDLHRATLARLEDLRGAEPQVRAELVNGLEAIVMKRKAA
ncbi:hypothetical protein [Marinicauda algicola]|uniref:hypothetical protein n=1 Tax=Marinicauda algicola TaxID=2029849 RepID=UPI0013054317|nr:hypothetical protein [Marinicauda algicola]